MHTLLALCCIQGGPCSSFLSETVWPHLTANILRPLIFMQTLWLQFSLELNSIHTHTHTPTLHHPYSFVDEQLDGFQLFAKVNKRWLWQSTGWGPYRTKREPALSTSIDLSLLPECGFNAISCFHLLPRYLTCMLFPISLTVCPWNIMQNKPFPCQEMKKSNQYRDVLQQYPPPPPPPRSSNLFHGNKI